MRNDIQSSVNNCKENHRVQRLVPSLRSHAHAPPLPPHSPSYGIGISNGVSNVVPLRPSHLLNHFNGCGLVREAHGWGVCGLGSKGATRCADVAPLQMI